MTTPQDVHAVVVATDKLVDDMLALAAKLWDPQATRGMFNVCEQVLAVINGDVQHKLADGDVQGAYDQAVRMHNVCVQVLQSEAPYPDAGAWRTIIDQTVRELQPAAVGAGVLLVVGVVAGLFLSRR